MRKIITIGREFGSGGRLLGRTLAEYLGIAYYDKEIITEIANRTQLSEDYVKNVVESHPSPLLPVTVGRSFNPMGNPMFQITQSVYAEQTKIIKEMAENSDCVIVGRCADYILREMNPWKIFVYASMESKMERHRARDPEVRSLTDKELRQKIIQMDKGRAKYYEFYTGNKWGDKVNYDVCINTSGIDIKAHVPHIAHMYECMEVR